MTKTNALDLVIQELDEIRQQMKTVKFHLDELKAQEQRLESAVLVLQGLQSHASER